MARETKQHGWTNDETWIVASNYENDEGLHEIMVNEASLAITEAIAAGHTSKRETQNVAAGLLVGALRQRQKVMQIRLDDVINRSRLPKEQKKDAKIILALSRYAHMERVNWREIARHYVSAFME